MISKAELAKRIKDRNPDIEEVFIHERGQEDKLREYGWERHPVEIDGKQIWIKRKPKSDTEKRQSRLTASA